MSRKYQKYSFPFVGGIDTKTDSKVLQGTKLPDLLDGIFTQHGKIQLRPGFESISHNLITSDGGDMGTIKALAALDTELVALTPDHLYSYSDGHPGWFEKGSLVSLIPEVKTISKAVSNQELADRAEVHGIAVTAWEDSRGGVYYSIEDTERGSFFIQNQLLTSTGQRPRTIALGDVLHLYWTDETTGYLYCKPISPTDLVTSLAASPKVVTDTLATSNAPYDVVPLYRTDYTYALIAYKVNTNQTRFHLVNTDGERPINPWGGSGYSDVAVDATMITVTARPVHGSILGIVTAYDGTTIYNYSISTSLVPFIPGTYTPGITLDNITCEYRYGLDYGGYEFRQYIEESAAQTYNHVVYQVTLDGDYNGTGRTVWSRHACLASKAFVVRGDASTEDDQLYLGIAYESTIQSTLFIYRDDGLLVAKLLSGVHGGCPAKPHLPQVQDIGASIFVLATNSKAQLEVNLGELPVFTDTGIVQVSLDFDAAQAYRAVQVGESLILTGGQTWSYDSAQATESGFHLFPENVTVAENGAGNLATGTAGAYSYLVVYESVNAKGERIQSTGLTVSFTTTGAGKKLRLTIPTLTHTYMDRVAIAVYRTIKDPPPGAAYHRVSSLDPSATGDNGYLVNDPTVNTVTFDDNYSDTALVSGELCYLNAQVDNIAPPASYAVCRTADRCWLVSAEDRREVWFSKLLVPGTQVGFNDNQVIELPSEATALESLNNTLVCFTRDQIFLVSGEGPSNLKNDANSLNSFSQPIPLPADAGCIDQRSLVRTKDGLMFRSAKGIYLLDQGFQLHYIGAEVEAYNDQDIVSATLLADRNLVIFLTDSGRSLAYDYFFRKWVPWSITGISGLILGETYYYATAGGIVLKMSETYSDNGALYSHEITTPWIAIDTRQGHQRVKRAIFLGDYHSAHRLRVQIAYDYDDIYSHTIEWDPADALNLTNLGDEATLGDEDVLGGTGNRVYQCRFRLPRQRCQAVRFKITGLPSEAGQGFSLSEMVLEIAGMTGANRLESTRNGTQN